MSVAANLGFKPQFERDGLQLFPFAATDQIDGIASAVQSLTGKAAGRRISNNSKIRRLLSRDGPLARSLSDLLQEDAIPVRAILFDKSDSVNWALGWHQDRTICVTERVREFENFGPWSIKQGLHHVEPPFAIIERMRTIRVHLDPVTQENGPLLIAIGSHQMGKIPVGQCDEVAGKCDIYACLAAAGDVWMYATPILHASERSRSLAPRRVLQVDYSADALPEGLDWMGV